MRHRVPRTSSRRWGYIIHIYRVQPNRDRHIPLWVIAPGVYSGRIHPRVSRLPYSLQPEGGTAHGNSVQNLFSSPSSGCHCHSDTVLLSYWRAE